MATADGTLAIKNSLAMQRASSRAVVPRGDKPRTKLDNCCMQFPEGPSTQYSRTLVPKTIKRMVFGTRILKYCCMHLHCWGLRMTCPAHSRQCRGAALTYSLDPRPCARKYWVNVCLLANSSCVEFWTKAVEPHVLGGVLEEGCRATCSAPLPFAPRLGSCRPWLFIVAATRSHSARNHSHPSMIIGRPLQRCFKVHRVTAQGSTSLSWSSRQRLQPRNGRWQQF